uniref:Uncharacterized protein n=1 Tax=Ditylenchus dipsaci TaxID=166011 RepID=A0A915ES02_9BILA
MSASSSSNSINPNRSSLNPVSQKSEPAIQPALQDTTTFEGLGTSGSSGQHLLRKRHSPNSSGVIGSRREGGEFGAAATAVAGDTPAFSAAQTKLRKVSTSSSFRAGSSNSHHSSNHEEIANKPGSSKNSVISHRRNSQLKYLTDYFPDQSTSSGEFTRLTRSKAKATTTLSFGQIGEDESVETPSSSFHFRSSHIPLGCQEKQSKKSGHYQHGHFSSSSTGDAGVIGGHRKLGLASAVPSALHHHHQRVLQFAPTQPPPQIHRPSMPSSSSANMGQQYMQSTSSLLGAPNTSMHFDLGSLSPSVIMSLPPASSSSNSQSQRHTDISSFASQLAAAVVSGAAGGAGQNVSVDVSSSASAAAIFAAAATSSAAAADYHQFLQESAAGSSGSGDGHSSSSIGINRASNYSSLTGKPSSSSSSVFGLKPQQHVNRTTSFLGSLVPRMQHLLSSSSGGSSSSLNMNSGTSSMAATGSGSIHIHHSSSLFILIGIPLNFLSKLPKLKVTRRGVSRHAREVGGYASGVGRYARVVCMHARGVGRYAGRVGKHARKVDRYASGMGRHYRVVGRYASGVSRYAS